MDKYKQISIRENYNKLLKSGMFWEFYPELSGVWNTDKDTLNGGWKPMQLKEINFEGLCGLCQKYIDFINDDEKYHEDNDYAHYIFEKTLETIYGKKIWNFIKNRR